VASYEQKTTGIENLTNHPLGKPLLLSASVGAKATTGTLIRKRGPDETESRTAGKNVTILRYWAKHGRNVIFLDPLDKERGIEMWKRACEAVIDGGSQVVMAEAEKVADIQIDAIRKHVQAGRRARGKIKPLKKGTIKRKERETGKKDQPVLVRTGQLMDSLIPYVRRLK